MSTFQNGLKDGFPTSWREYGVQQKHCKCEDTCACSDVMQRVTGFQTFLHIVCKSGQLLNLSLKTYIVNSWYVTILDISKKNYQAFWCLILVKFSWFLGCRRPAIWLIGLPAWYWAVCPRMEIQRRSGNEALLTVRWFEIFFIFTPYLGKWWKFDEHIFQMGWNHHLG